MRRYDCAAVFGIEERSGPALHKDVGINGGGILGGERKAERSGDERRRFNIVSPFCFLVNTMIRGGDKFGGREKRNDYICSFICLALLGKWGDPV